jgi:hypothetical protein
MHKSHILQTTPEYFCKILKYHDVKFANSASTIPYIVGFADYNYLIDINTVFSTRPVGDVIDRTNTVRFPFKMHIERPWVIPLHNNKTFDLCIASRVQELVNHKQKINIFWSGGIDSTTVVVGFLKHCNNLSQIRILYTTASMKENPYFFLLLTETKNLELIEFSGDVYLNQNLDGIFVNGDGADDLTASLDVSFFEKYGFDGCGADWKQFFFEKTKNIEFVNFCENYYSMSGREIKSVIEARWWFYANSKIQKFPALASGILQPNQPLMIGFFDYYMFEHYMFFNIDKLLKNKNYSTYKYQFKEYIFDYDKNYTYLKNKTKVNSSQIGQYIQKKLPLQDLRSIMLLGDGTRIKTKNLPFLSEKEYRNKYQHTLDYLFNV